MCWEKHTQITFLISPITEASGWFPRWKMKPPPSWRWLIFVGVARVKCKETTVFLLQLWQKMDTPDVKQSAVTWYQCSNRHMCLRPIKKCNVTNHQIILVNQQALCGGVGFHLLHHLLCQSILAWKQINVSTAASQTGDLVLTPNTNMPILSLK